MKISNGEGWWLVRRRSGKTMREWIENVHWDDTLALSEDRLRAWEKGRAEAPSPGRCHAWPPLTFGEYITLGRRRAGYTLPALAVRLGVSRQTLWKAEHDLTSSAYDMARFWAREYPEAPPGPGLRIRAPSL